MRPTGSSVEERLLISEGDADVIVAEVPLAAIVKLGTPDPDLAGLGVADLAAFPALERAIPVLSMDAEKHHRRGRVRRSGGSSGRSTSSGSISRSSNACCSTGTRYTARWIESTTASVDIGFATVSTRSSMTAASEIGMAIVGSIRVNGSVLAALRRAYA